MRMLLALLFASAYGAAAQPYSVYVFTAPEGHADKDRSAVEELKDRVDSVEDVKKALADRKYRDLFTIVDEEDKADLAVDVMFRGPVETTQSGPPVRITPGRPGSPDAGMPSRILQNNIRLRLTLGDDEETVWAIEPGKTGWFGTAPQLAWRALADKAAERIARWVRDKRHR